MQASFFKDFDSRFPWQSFRLASGRAFRFRYHKNPSAKATLMLLIGSIGLSDVWRRHFEILAADYSVLCFDYSVASGGTGSAGQPGSAGPANQTASAFEQVAGQAGSVETASQAAGLAKQAGLTETASKPGSAVEPEADLPGPASQAAGKTDAKEFRGNKELCGDIEELLEILDERVWVVGQSYGGILAQIFACLHPERIEGLILSNTCSINAEMSKAAYRHLKGMLRSQRFTLAAVRTLPFGLIRAGMIAGVKAMARVGTAGRDSRKDFLMEEYCAVLEAESTRDYEIFMCRLLADCEQFYGARKSDFARWDGRVLLLLSEDDKTFNDACKQSLIACMPQPKLVTSLLGGHLAFVTSPELYCEEIGKFVRPSEKK